MRGFIALLATVSFLPLYAQGTYETKPAVPAAVIPQAPLDYVCPMDADVRSDKPGVCPRCGMKLVLGIPDDSEYRLQLTLSPPAARAGQKVQFTFRVIDPKTNKTVNHFEVVHEMLFHMFVVSQDLKYFLHDHPVPQPDGRFLFDMVFPKPGMYRIAGDFYPTGGTPQLAAQTVFVRGATGTEVPLEDAKLRPELNVSRLQNMDVELVMDPPQPIAGLKTMLFFKISPPDGIEKYLGAWAHMVAASDDLIDLIHDHPFIADGGPQMQFNIIFPRAHTYRIWVQFQRNGIVNTSSFTIPVSELK